jgi:diacylglycerol kinase (ATP)
VGRAKDHLGQSGIPNHAPGGNDMIKFKQSRSRLASFHHAFAGWWYVLRTQRNAWIHALATIGVIVLGIWLGIERRDWAVLLLAIGLVWLAEFLNTALEAVVDLASPKMHPLARVGKDVGAAAVLISAATSAVIGILILGPPLLEKFGR